MIYRLEETKGAGGCRSSGVPGGSVAGKPCVDINQLARWLPVDATMLAVLLGASVVGIADQLESRLPRGYSPLLWKTVTLPVGFAAAYGLAAERWNVAAIAGLALVVLAVLFLLPRRLAAADEAVVEKLEQQMKKCC